LTEVKCEETWSDFEALVLGNIGIFLMSTGLRQQIVHKNAGVMIFDSKLLKDMKIEFFTFFFTNLDRELSKGRDGGKAEPSPPRSERRLLQIVVRRDHVFQDSYLQVGLGIPVAVFQL
jgi:hypothetical protein